MNDYYYWIAGIFIAIILFTLLLGIFKASTKKDFESSTKSTHFESSAKNDKNIGYIGKEFLTPSEKHFLSLLKEVETLGLIVVPQINLATIIQKTGKYTWQNELFRNIDYGIFDGEYKLLLLIELNDKSHQQYNRRNRDIKVHDILRQANIDMITFYTNMPNKAEYVVNRVMNKIKDNVKNLEGLAE